MCLEAGGAKVDRQVVDVLMMASVYRAVPQDETETKMGWTGAGSLNQLVNLTPVRA